MNEDIKKMLQDAQSIIDRAGKGNSCKVETPTEEKENDGFVRQETRCESCNG